jgi:DNA gyrase subunit A
VVESASGSLGLKTVSIASEMKKSYLDYAMSVIVSRAIPDVRDGLKPVHRRILYAMMESGFDYNKPYKKSARIVGDVMGKYHPHGDSAIYDALVRMAQDFSMSTPLVDGQGNFGSMDGDPAAAMRYTESRLAKVAQLALLEDIDKDTVRWQDNYDGSEQEPTVLPARFPNVLVNGANGIAVGMATNIPPHNLGEIVDATCKLIDEPETTIDELMQIVPGPDFPTGGIILGRSGAHSAAHTGRGSVIMRGKTEIEESKGGKAAIIITEVPYQVNKARLVEKIAELVREKKIEGISDLRDESDKSGVRVVVEVKKDAVPDVVLAQLYSYTPLQCSFPVNALALNNGRPQVMNLKDVLEAFITFREEVITKRTHYLLNKARDKAHTLIGLAIAVANIDEVIQVIRSAPDPVVAREELMRRDWNAADVLPLLALVDDKRNAIINAERIKFTEEQARAILELRLQRLTGLERDKIDGELKELGAEISRYLTILGNRSDRMAIMRAELVEVKELYAVPRRTVIEDSEFEADIEDLIQREDMVVTVTAGGYIKRTPLAAFRAQRRGGKGKSGIAMREEDATEELFVANTHTPVLFFSNFGKVYKLKVYRLPLATAQGRGKALVNIFPLAEGETIKTFMTLPEDESTWDGLNIMFATSMGTVRRNDLSDFHDIRTNGKIAMKLEDEGERLVDVKVCAENDHVLIAAKSGKCVRFPVDNVRVFKSRASTGVRAMKLADGDCVMSMSILKGTQFSMEERVAYLKLAAEKRRASGDAEAEATVNVSGGHDEELAEVTLTEERARQLEEGEELILTLTEKGYGKRSSAYEYRVTNRGGSGIVNIITNERNGQVVMSFPVKCDDQIMLMTDKGKMIRTKVCDIRVAGRNTQGVRVFNVDKDERVVSAVCIDGAQLAAAGADEDEGMDGDVTMTEAPDAPAVE